MSRSAEDQCAKERRGGGLQLPRKIVASPSHMRVFRFSVGQRKREPLLKGRQKICCGVALEQIALVAVAITHKKPRVLRK
jgi:hypothetical protein